MDRALTEASETAQHVVGMDLGGTKILAAVVDGGGQIVAEVKQRTKAEKGPNIVLKRMIDTAQQAVSKAGLDWAQVAGVGIGAPGPMDPEKGIVYSPPNLPGWDAVAVGPRLSATLGVPVYLENDVNLGTLGEHALGAGMGTQDMVGVFVGTGVGGGLILDGKLHGGARHAAAELGHMIVLADGPVCGCGRRGCLEAVASRTAIVRDIELGLAAGRNSLIPKLTRNGKRGMTSGVLAKALHLQDALVTEVMGRAQWYLGLHAATIINFIDPEMIVFGGGVAEALGEEFLQPIRVTARQYAIQQAGIERVRMVNAQLGDYAAVLGAAVHVRQMVSGPSESCTE